MYPRTMYTTQLANKAANTYSLFLEARIYGEWDHVHSRVPRIETYRLKYRYKTTLNGPSGSVTFEQA